MMQAQDDTSVKLSRDRRTMIAISQSDKRDFDALKNGRYDWQVFREMLLVYKEHLASNGEAAA